MTDSLFSLDDLQDYTKPKVKKATAARTRDPSRTVLVRHQDTLAEAIGKIEPGISIHYATGGTWATHDLIYYICEQIGAADVYGATWSLSEPAAKQMIEQINHGKIKSMRFIFDWRVKVRTPEALQLAVMNSVDIRLTTCHAKVAVLDTDDMSVAIVSSANFTNNPRIEAGVICTDPAIAEFHRSWIMAEISKSKPFED